MKSWLVAPSMKAGFFISLYSFKQNGQPTGLLKYPLPFLTASCDDPKTPRRILFSGSGKNGHPCLWTVWIPLKRGFLLIKYFSVIFWIRISISIQYKLKNLVHSGLNKHKKYFHDEMFYRNNSSFVTCHFTFHDLRIEMSFILNWALFWTEFHFIFCNHLSDNALIVL